MKPKVRKGEVTRFLDSWFAVRQFIQASNFNRFQGAGLSATQFMALNLLPANGDGIPMGELARRMNLKPATVAQTIDSLEARKMISRTRGDLDKRMIFVAVTEVGLDLQNAASRQFRNQMAELLASMAEEEREGLIRGLEGLVRAMRIKAAGDAFQIRHPDAGVSPAGRNEK